MRGDAAKRGDVAEGIEGQSGTLMEARRMGGSDRWQNGRIANEALPSVARRGRRSMRPLMDGGGMVDWEWRRGEGGWMDEWAETLTD